MHPEGKCPVRQAAPGNEGTYDARVNAELFSATILLILVIDPFGNVPLVVSALKNVAPERRARVVLRECVAAYVILLAFMIGGRTFLHWLHLTEESLTIAGGIILFLIAIRMVFPRPEGIFGDPPGGEPFLVPLAIPSIAGPSALATVMLMASRDPAKIGSWVIALTVAMVATTVVLALADRLQRWLGERAVLAFERLMGLVLTALAVEMLLGGLRTFVGGIAK
jgi:small neutral amino acid transporter SnatA (MarC family)